MNPAPPNWFYVYLLQSKPRTNLAWDSSRTKLVRDKQDKAIYIGCTANLQKRMKEHNDGKVYTTKKMLPVEPIYFEAYRSKKAAFEREKRLKYHGNALRKLKLRIEDVGFIPTSPKEVRGEAIL